MGPLRASDPRGESPQNLIDGETLPNPQPEHGCVALVTLRGRAAGNSRRGSDAAPSDWLPSATIR